MGYREKNMLIASCLLLVSFLLIAIAFSTPCWLENDGQLPDATFQRIGLWQVCFKNFEEPHHWYDTKFTGCWWVFEEEYYIIHDFLLPGFFVATQTFFTFCLTFLLICLLFLARYVFTDDDDPHMATLLFIICGCSGFSAFCGTISVVIFGAYGDSRYWMPHWEHNYIGWSYALAVVAILLMWIATAQIFGEGRVHSARNRRERQRRAAYGLGRTVLAYLLKPWVPITPRERITWAHQAAQEPSSMKSQNCLSTEDLLLEIH